MKSALTAFLFLSTSAAGLHAQNSKTVPFEQCFTDAARHYSVNKVVLVAIAKTESHFNPSALSKPNTNGTLDIGIMQINSAWLPTLKKSGISKADLFNPCANIHIGAWILSENINSHGNTWKAVGAYNARSPIKQVAYVSKVMTAATDINLNYQFK